MDFIITAFPKQNPPKEGHTALDVNSRHKRAVAITITMPAMAGFRLV